MMFNFRRGIKYSKSCFLDVFLGRWLRVPLLGLRVGQGDLRGPFQPEAFSDSVVLFSGFQ